VPEKNLTVGDRPDAQAKPNQSNMTFTLSYSDQVCNT